MRVRVYQSKVERYSRSFTVDLPADVDASDPAAILFWVEQETGEGGDMAALADREYEDWWGASDDDGGPPISTDSVILLPDNRVGGNSASA